MNLTAERRHAAAAHHEAGHAVVGVLSGATIDLAEVVRGGSRTNPGGIGGFCRYDLFDFAAETRRREITAAGSIAEAVFLHGPSPTARQIDQVLMTNGRDRSELRQMCLAVGEPLIVPTAEVLPLVVRCWPSIEELAARLSREGQIRHTDVLAALSIPSPELTAQHVAAIRSGSDPGTFTITPPVGASRARRGKRSTVFPHGVAEAMRV